MFLSGSYIIFDINGEGKEYSSYDDSLKFEGEYLNGKRNGKGKEYYHNGSLLFEVEYLNGKKNGKGKKYNYEGNLIFEGEYSNGKINGIGKEYYDDNKIRFEGEYKNGLRWNGKGYDNQNNIVYELKNGKGYVKEYYINGKLYLEYECLNDLKNGKGKDIVIKVI